MCTFSINGSNNSSNVDEKIKKRVITKIQTFKESIQMQSDLQRNCGAQTEINFLGVFAKHLICIIILTNIESACK